MRITATALIAVTALAGCATVNKQPLDSQSAAEIKNQTVTYTTRKKPDFTAMTAGKAAFGLLGVSAMISTGNEIVANNDVPDPAESIALGLAKELEKADGAHLVNPPVSTETDDVSQISSQAGNEARYIIDAQTVDWSFVYFPTDWTHYRVLYAAKARLIDVQKHAVIAEGLCKPTPDSDEGAPTYDELLADQATRLKSKLVAAANECVKELKSQMLAL